MSEMAPYDFLLKNSQKLSEKYAGKYLALVGDKLVAVGKDMVEVYRDAKKKFPRQEISISYMPTDRELVTLLCL